MASSSTANGSSASSSSSSFDSSGIQREYEVFLSYRGIDTGKNFTDHLNYALKDRGICTYRDDERLERGMEISSELLKAIEISSVSIIVLSKNYASSTWCLEELAKIVDCMATKKQKVFPVFYKVDPLDVWKQRGDVEAAFHKHEKYYEDNPDKVQRWRSALTRVGNLSGWHVEESSSEAGIIKDIVDQISKRLKPTSSKVAEDLVGIKSRLEEINDLLESGLDDIRFIGICGMGGIGKTTIAKVLYNMFSGDYDGSCFLADVREVSSKKGVVHLQEILFSKVLNETSLNICQTDGGIDYFTRQRLRRTRVFVVLDNVDQLEQLEKLAGNHNWFGFGSRIIITTRDKHVLVGHGISSIYEVKGLKYDDALQLFHMKAFRQGQPTDDYVELSMQIVKCTNGLPLVLKVLGSHLCGRTVKEWKSEWNRLRHLQEILCGQHLQGRSEAGIIKDVVDKISIRRKPTSSKVAEDLVGIKSGLDDKRISSENYEKLFTDLIRQVDGGADGRRVGKLFVSNKEIAKGSNGTIVLEGIHEGRPVAVKRLLLSHHDDVAFKEIENLIASDRHPNIVRWYGKESDRYFVYLSLELCICSLDDLIQMNSDSSHNSSLDEGQDTKAMTEYKLRLDSVKGIMQGHSLWKANGHPSPLLLKLMKDMVSGLVHLHKLRIVHRDLKPQNVLISTLDDISDRRSLCAKLSDMGISKRLLADMSSLGHPATGCGTSGWQPPEQLLNGRQTRAVDLFSLGCVLYFCITRGRHPFGNRHERDNNIEKNQMNLFSVECIPEAEDLISRLLNPNPELRPSAYEVLHHPLFWSSEKRLSFVRDTSDRVEFKDRETYSALLEALENTASVAQCIKWNEKLELIFFNNINTGRYRRYGYDSVQDLLRVMRNKLNHYRELPKEIQELVGPVPEGFDGYFATRFPRLLIEVYKVVCRYCREEECFQK